MDHKCESGGLASAKCKLLCSLCSVCDALGWITTLKVVVWPQPNAHFCDRCDPFVKITNVKVVVWPQPNAHFCDRCVQLVMLWDGSQM